MKKIVEMTWSNGFAMGEVVPGSYKPIGSFIRLIKNFRARKYLWGVEEGEREIDEAENTVWKVDKRTRFKTKAAAEEFMLKLRAALPNPKTHAARKPSLDEEDLEKSRIKVLREQYPRTFAAKEAKKSAEQVYQAFSLDMVQLHKPKDFPAALEPLPRNLKFLSELAKAFKEKSPLDAVDVELTTNWLSKGYNKMSCADYTRAINGATGANLTAEAMEKRRYHRHGLMTKKSPGPPPRT